MKQAFDVSLLEQTNDKRKIKCSTIADTVNGNKKHYSVIEENETDIGE